MSDGEICCEDLHRIYNPGMPNECRALDGVSLKIGGGDYASIIGPSGSGKSTLLNLISCLDSPTKGEVYIEDVPISRLNGFKKAKLRRLKLGFIFQQFNLIPTMSSAENIELPMRFKGVGKTARRKRIRHLLDVVGLEGKGKNKPNQLSGGQQQRVAVARSLANDPKIILADEPTGNLDTKTGKKIMDLLTRLNREEDKTLIIVTHDLRIAKKAVNRIRLVDGKVK